MISEATNNRHPTRRLLLAALAGGLACSITMGQTVVSEAAHQQFVFAYRLLQRGEDKLAAEAFDEYLGRFPKDDKRGDAIYYRALLARRSGDDRAAAQLLKDAPSPTLVPDYAVLLLRGQVHSDLGDYDEAIKSLEKINVNPLEPTAQASVLYLRGLVYRSQKNLPAAAAQLALVAKINSPLRARSLLDLARVQARLDKPAEGIESLRRCLALKSSDVGADAARLAGDLSYQSKHYPQATEFYKIIMTRYSSSRHMGPAILGVLWSQLKSGHHGDLAETFQQYKNKLPKDQRTVAWYLAASAQQELDRHDQAITLFNRILANASGSAIEDRILYKLAASQFELSQYRSVETTVARLLKRHPYSPRIPDAEFLLALVSVRQGNATTGASRLSAIVNVGAEHPYFSQALLQRARLYEANKQKRPAAADYERYLKFARAATADARPDQASADQAALRLIDLYLQLDDGEHADGVAQQLLARRRLDPLVQAEAMYRRGLALMKLKEYERAHDILGNLLTKQPQNRYVAEAHYYRGLIKMTLQRPDEAIADLKQAAEANEIGRTFKINALRLMAVRLEERQDHAQAADALVRLVKLVGLEQLKPQEQLMLGRYFISQGKPRTAQKYLLGIVQKNSRAEPVVRAEALFLAGVGLRQVGDTKAAIAAFREVIALGQGFDLEARLQLAKTYAQLGEHEEALGEYRDLIISEQTAIAAEAIFSSARIYREIAAQKDRVSDVGGAAKARTQAAKHFKRLILLYSFPEISPLMQLSYIELAEIAEEQGGADAAGAHYNELAKKYPDGPYATYAQAMTNQSVAISILRQLRRRPLDPRLAHRVAARLKGLEAAP